MLLSTRNIWLTIALVAGTWLASGCSRVAEPDQALSIVLKNLDAGRAEKVWEGLSDKTKRTLEDRAKARGITELTPSKLVFELLELTVLHTPTKLTVAEPGPDRSIVVAEVPDQRAARFVMVLENGRWKLDLFSSLEQVRTSTTPEPLPNTETSTSGP